jgi:hypothetical protein
MTVAMSRRAEAQESLNVGIYAPSASFPDSGARLAYIQGLAKAISTKTGIPTTGKAYVRLADLMAAKPDFAIVEGLCIAAKSPGTVLATASINGDTTQTWGLFARGDGGFSGLKGKKLAFVQTGCRDADFIDNAMLDSEVKTKTFFESLVDKQDVSGAVAAVKDFKAADAVFAPTGQAKGLTKLFDTGTVPNPGFVVIAKGLPAGTVDKVKEAVLGYGANLGIDGWKGAASYSSLAGQLGARTKRAVFASPEPVRLDDSDVLIVPTSEFQTATVRQHFWDPAAAQ